MRIPQSNFSHCIEVLDFITELHNRSKTCRDNDVIGFFQKSNSYTKSAIETLIILGVLDRNNGIISWKKNPGKDSSKKLITNGILGYQPFVEYLYFTGRGKSEQESAAMVVHLYGLENSIPTLLKIFHSMQKQIGIERGRYKIPESLIHKDENIVNIAEATLYIKNCLGEHYHEMPEQVVRDFIEAILIAKSDASKAVTDAGRGLEDFLRLSLCKNIDLKKRDGLGQIANAMNEHQDMYPAKLNNLVLGLSGIRSMGDAHGADKKILERWALKPETAKAFISLSLNAMAGYLMFKSSNILVL